MTREEVNVVFTGIAHDHLMGPSKIHHQGTGGSATNNYKQQQQQYQVARPVATTKSNNDNHHLLSNCNHQHHHLQSHHHNQTGGYAAVENQKMQAQSQNIPPPCPPDVAVTSTQEQQKQQRSAGATSATSPKTTLPCDNASAQSTIAILRRMTMYDSLVLVKKYRPCLNGYTFEFPSTSNDSVVATSDSQQNRQQRSAGTETDFHADNLACGRTKLVSVYLDGDDLLSQCQLDKMRQQQQQQNATGADAGQSTEPSSMPAGGSGGDGEIVYVPVNGLLDRLENYDRNGIAIDSRVYAFAMGLKTAERFLTSSAEKEIQEAPPL